MATKIEEALVVVDKGFACVALAIYLVVGIRGIINNTLDHMDIIAAIAATVILLVVFGTSVIRDFKNTCKEAYSKKETA